jgi:serine/threonine-protein kinase
VFELGEIDGRYFIAMEYLEGVPFACFRRRDLYPAHPDPRLVAGPGVQACEGLHHAHNLKRPDGSAFEVVHRDVSSNNLFATVDGMVKVLDFGIAKVQDASVRTSTGSVKGTYAYMAPEQLRGERLDRRTDVFAVGIVMWELFGRRHLFKRDTEFLTFQAITTDPIQDISELRPDVPPEMVAVIGKALSRNRDDRFPTARALGEALAQSVSAIGGPWSAAQISDEITRAFEVRLRDQQALIRVAREGGALELTTDVGQAVGHGTDLMSTPVSIISTRGSIPGVPKPTPSKEISVPSVARAAALPTAPARGPRFGVIALVVLALGGIGAAVYFYLETRKQKQHAEPDKVVMTPITESPAPAPQVAPPAPPDAAPARAVEPDAAVIALAPPDAAVATPPVAPPRGATIRRTTQPDRTTPRPPAGPPGFITIDASPVYAIVFIDGKRYGETPLVRLSLAPGPHKVRAVSPSGSSRNFTITIESGKVAPTKRIEW